jgi:hypothetical protein
MGYCPYDCEICGTEKDNGWDACVCDKCREFIPRDYEERDIVYKLLMNYQKFMDEMKSICDSEKHELSTEKEFNEKIKEDLNKLHSSMSLYKFPEFEEKISKIEDSESYPGYVESYGQHYDDDPLDQED